jgi:hypothetical protein
MTNLLDNIRQRFAPVHPIPPGIYHYISPPEDPRNYRLHLRVEPGGTGVLIVNAATVLHLNETATEYAYYFVKNMPAAEVAHKMSHRYHVEQEQAYNDYQDFAQRIMILIETPDLDPVTFLDFARRTPYSGKLSAPYRLDCALTYQLPEGADSAFAPTDRVKREMTTDEWKQVLDKAWNAGIPHAVFTGGEPTLRTDLVELVAYAESLGMVSGLLTDGVKLADGAYFGSLLGTGLDHMMLLYQGENEAFWAALRSAIPADIFAAVHLTITLENQTGYAQVLRNLAEIGLTAISLTASSPELNTVLEAAREEAATLGLELVWDLPVPYSAQHPVKLEVPGAERVDGAGRAWLYVEPDGDVLPSQGELTMLGNLLTDPWEVIWKGRSHGNQVTR